MKQCKCIDCGKNISYPTFKYGGQRCRKCAGLKRRGFKHSKKTIEKIKQYKGSRHWRYEAENHKKHYCKICKIVEITYQTWKYGSERCVSCAMIKHGKYKELHYCVDCGKEVSTYAKRCHDCNNLILGLKLAGKNHPRYINGLSLEPYPMKFNTKLKTKIKKRDNFKCQICGKPEIEQKYKLHVHHIDYDKENCNEDNLITLCGSCHIKTNFNRNYWFAFFVYIMENWK